MYDSSRDGSDSRAMESVEDAENWSLPFPSFLRQPLFNATVYLPAFISLTRFFTSKSRGRPGTPYDFSEGDTARQIVLSVRLESATTRFVVSGSSFRSMHSTEAKNDLRSIAM